jgi:hypothetical protein
MVFIGTISDVREVTVELHEMAHPFRYPRVFGQSEAAIWPVRELT